MINEMDRAVAASSIPLGGTEKQMETIYSIEITLTTRYRIR